MRRSVVSGDALRNRTQEAACETERAKVTHSTAAVSGRLRHRRQPEGAGGAGFNINQQYRYQGCRCIEVGFIVTERRTHHIRGINRSRTEGRRGITGRYGTRVPSFGRDRRRVLSLSAAHAVAACATLKVAGRSTRMRPRCCDTEICNCRGVEAHLAAVAALTGSS